MSDCPLKDWAPDLSQASVIYIGVEVLACLKAEAKFLKPRLPPMSLTGSLPLEQLVDGTSSYTRGRCTGRMTRT